MKKMLELFSGSGNMSKAFQEAGYRTLSVDLDTPADINCDIRELTPQQVLKELGGRPDVIWASPPCTAFSVAAISRNFKEGVPYSNNSFLGIDLLSQTLRLIMQLKPKKWYIENPRGMMRTLDIMEFLPRKTLTFCQYGDKAQKPTDIWTNDHSWIPRQCKKGRSCHELSPRGNTKTGTQGKKTAELRGVLPMQLCREIALGSLEIQQSLDNMTIK
jgi:hypothetical protein